MCWLCDDNDGEYVGCQDCGRLLCEDFGEDDVASRPYVTASGDLFCARCGRQYDEAEEAGYDDLDFEWEYGASWCDPGSDLDTLEDTPQTIWIGNDHCPKCGSGNTERIDTVNGDDDPAIWFVQCGNCGETFEVVIPKDGE